MRVLQAAAKVVICALHAELMQGRTKHALAIAAKMDNWLAAHVADLMVPIGLLDTEIDEM